MRPGLFIITGSNGAGKSTIGATYLPPKIQQDYTVFDGDKLMLQKRKELLKTIRSVKEAGKMADEWVFKSFTQQVKSAIGAKDHFAYEGHFRNRIAINTPRKFKRNGYVLNLIFMGLTDPELSELRVIDRARHGGHNVPIHHIRFNFYGNLAMLNENFKLFDDVLVIDTSKNLQHKILLHLIGKKISFYTPLKELPEWFTKFLPKLTELIKAEEGLSFD